MIAIFDVAERAVDAFVILLRKAMIDSVGELEVIIPAVNAIAEIYSALLTGGIALFITHIFMTAKQPFAG